MYPEVCLLSPFSSEQEQTMTYERGERGRSHARHVHLCRRLFFSQNKDPDFSQGPLTSPSNRAESFCKRRHAFTAISAIVARRPGRRRSLVASRRARWARRGGGWPAGRRCAASTAAPRSPWTAAC